MSIKEFSTPEWTIKIDHDLCVGSGECIEVWPVDVYELNDDQKSEAIRVDDCTECCLCVESCPTGAIEHTSCE